MLLMAAQTQRSGVRPWRHVEYAGNNMTIRLVCCRPIFFDDQWTTNLIPESVLPVEEQVFLLLNYGHNYSRSDIMAMPTPVRWWHIGRLSKQNREDKEAVNQAKLRSKQRK